MPSDIICFSHLRWNFVYQRPQHLLSRFAKNGRVFFLEEPVVDEGSCAYTVHQASASQVMVVVPHVRHGLSDPEMIEHQRKVVNSLMRERGIRDEHFIAWYYSPMALAFSSHLSPELTVYDCMDELSAFKFAPPELKEREEELLRRADIVFTGGHTLYEAKKHRHHNIHAFPSSIDKKHFERARYLAEDPADQSAIARPRLGFFGVIDERFDISLVDGAAELRPDLNFVLVGPVVKIDPATLPRRNNIHYLGGKDYEELPSYLAGWDVAIMPFARNESTRFISPTKTPEYLSGGKPVISTSITDVVNDYAKKGLVCIADTPEEFIRCVDDILSNGDRSKWLADVDAQLSDNSWDITCKRMTSLMAETKRKKYNITREETKTYV
jgi:glycosyltransferase involved in cell wall biosynthesis